MNKKRPWAKRKATWHKWFVASRDTRNKGKRASYQAAKLNALPPAELLKVLSGGVDSGCAATHSLVKDTTWTARTVSPVNANPASAPAKVGAEKFSSKGERKCSVVQRDGLIAGTGSARFTAGARKIVFRCPEQLEVRQGQLTLRKLVKNVMKKPEVLERQFAEMKAQRQGIVAKPPGDADTAGRIPARQAVEFLRIRSAMFTRVRGSASEVRAPLTDYDSVVQ